MDERVSRRRFVQALAVAAGIGSAGVLVACGDETPTTVPPRATFVPSAPTPPVPETVVAGADGYAQFGKAAEYLPNADPAAFTVGDLVGYIFNSNGKLFVFQSKCTHQGCIVPYVGSQSKFICPCHGSEYDKTGVVLQGPATRRLPILDAKIENGQLLVKVG